MKRQVQWNSQDYVNRHWLRFLSLCNSLTGRYWIKSIKNTEVQDVSNLMNCHLPFTKRHRRLTLSAEALLEIEQGVVSKVIN